MDLGNGLGHLTYSTLVHPADNWEQLWDEPEDVRAEGEGARLAQRAVRRVHPAGRADGGAARVEPAERDKLKRFLADNDMYVYTANAFPYGAFKGTVVKEQVYEPDWRTEERTQYTINVADILADICAAKHPAVHSDGAARVQTERHRPGRRRQLHRARAARGRAPRADRSAHRPAGDARHRAGAALLPRNDGRDRRLLHEASLHRRVRRAAVEARRHPDGQAHGALRRHLGIVFDIGHQAVGFEDIPTSLQKLVDAGIPIFKLQEVAAMHIPEVTQKAVDALAQFAKTVYLSQTVEKKDGRITKFLNLEDAFAAWKSGPRARASGARTSTCRCSSRTSARSARRGLRSRRRSSSTRATPLSRQLEIETYTWDVLPDHLKTGDIVDYVCREIEWVKKRR